MKKLILFFVFGAFSTITNAQVTVSSNTVGSSSAFLGTSDNFDVIFKRQNFFAGRLDVRNLSFGVNSYDSTSGVNTITSTAFNTCIGFAAGQHNYKGNFVPGGSSGGWSNTYIGYNAGKGLTGTTVTVPTNGYTASANLFVGAFAGENITTGSNNVFLGANAGSSNQAGSFNLFIGKDAGAISTTSNNIFVGYQSGFNATGTNNIFIGQLAGMTPSSLGPSGQRNLCLGWQSGRNLVTGGFNTFIGNVELPNSVSNDLNVTTGSNTNNTIILADGYGNQRLFVHNNGRTGFDLGNNNIPQNRLELNSTGAVANTLGLRFRNCPTTSIVNPTNNVLSVNAQGDVILVEDKQSSNPGGLSTTCNTANFITKSLGSTGDLTCSQIFDNGTSVGIGTTGSFTVFNPTTGQPEILKLDVNGITRTIGLYTSSDKKFKKDIQPIESALDKIMNLEGKTYNWRKDEFKDKNFTSELQYGLIAQDVQKVIPSLVIES